MEALILSDNWTLQNAGEFISQGLNGSEANELILPEDGSPFRYQPISADLVRFDALCQILNHLVLADQILVDGDYTNHWEAFTFLGDLQTAGIIVPKPFRSIQEQWETTREDIVEQLCVSSSLRKAHLQNKQQWQEEGKVVDNFLSEMIWGGAGMLARANFLKIPYSPHPLRSDLFRRARFVMKRNAPQSLRGFVSSEQSKIYQHVGGVGFTATIHLPPVAAQAIQDSKDPESLVSTALQLRDHYREVRNWLAQLQSALNDESMADLLKHQKDLQSISAHLEAIRTGKSTGDTTVQIGFSWLKLNVKVESLVNFAGNKLGMKAEISRLVLSPAGQSVIDKLLRMFGEKHTANGRYLKNALEFRSREEFSER